MRNLMLLIGGLCCGTAGAAPLNPCLLTPAELAPVLGHEPEVGRAERDPRGTPMCIYETKGELGKRFLLLIYPTGWDQRRYANRLSLAEGSGIRVAHKFTDIGQAAFYVDGVGGALQGPRYVELSGFKQAGRRQVQAEEAGNLLKLVLSRLPAG